MKAIGSGSVLSPQDLIHSVDLKLRRAAAQVDTLSNQISAWTSRNPVTARIELREGRLGFRLILEDFADYPPLDDWGLTIGECVHNLRSALDNLAFALSRRRCDPPSRPDRVRFPICQDRSKFNKDSRGSLDQMQVEAAALVEQVQPFQRNKPDVEGTSESHPLVLLKWLSNHDKHRVPSVVLLSPTKTSFGYITQFYSEEDAKESGPPNITVRLDPLEPGVILAEHKTSRPIKGIHGSTIVHAIVSIQTIQQPAPIDTVMLKLCDHTTKVVDQFRGFFK